MMRLFQAVLAAALLLPQSGCTWLRREKRIREPVRADFSVADPEFAASTELLGAPLVGGNSLVQLVNGDAIFPAMLEAIRGAKKSVDLEMFIFRGGKAGDPFIDALSERARAGVKVKLIVDAIGSLKLSDKDIRKMATAGVRILRYNPALLTFFRRANHRTHRKILVVDGRVGVTGGVCVNDEWLGNAEPGHWRDTMVRVEGPVVAQMQAVFADNWEKGKSEALLGADYFPADLGRPGAAPAQFVGSGPHEDVEKARLSFLLSIAAARHSILVSAAYFAPDSLMIKAFRDARRRGVRVEIIVPAKSDNIAVQEASMPRWRPLLDSGVEIFEYEPTLYHPKIMIIDGLWSIVGSTNFDARSLKLNDEADIHVLDRAFAQDLTLAFEADKAQSRRLTAADLNRRNVFQRLTARFFGLFRAQL